jgi:hypothetical protein
MEVLADRQPPTCNDPLEALVYGISRERMETTGLAEAPPFVRWRRSDQRVSWHWGR